MDYETDSRGGYGDSRDNYDRDRSGSPRTRSPDNNTRMRSRSASPGGRADARPDPSDTTDRRDKDASPEKDGSRNTGTNLFVTGIHPRLTEEDVTRLFGKYGEIIKCNIMVDPHTKESRGFGFVNFAQSDQADAAKDALQGEVYEGRTLSIEKARRSRPRTPTPGKYFGPPKRDDFRRGPPSYSGRPYGGSRGGGSYPPRGYEEDRYYRGGGGRYESRYDDRYYGSRREHGDDYGRGGIDRYASGREERYSGGGREERRGGGGGGGGGYYDREGGRPPYEGGRPRDGAAAGGEDRYNNAAAEPASGRGGAERTGGGGGGGDRGYYDREERYSRR
ncbi:hypothetical protein TWF173_003092 [Orbilia oligospora]|uniref:RRM domain-containing protein n=1 Tax=Arthrobotrys oligospora (strain ATCC 24927 / CBS 115.81 / DSM 1491) TaxID=756982 RepID=G1XI62_ARTOA|nr:hypothetical protein AOL_s00097g39 [Orbilia oligospora ATCC 24927]EGX47200.1 hypothetical protein AOL_s00097g39 [Orbilia oligospora ATCC 24927]KAF3315896.1 hypothetical protein TWF173_003092 [Orbilia oligospora]